MSLRRSARIQTNLQESTERSPCSSLLNLTKDPKLQEESPRDDGICPPKTKRPKLKPSKGCGYCGNVFGKFEELCKHLRDAHGHSGAVVERDTFSDYGTFIRWLNNLEESSPCDFRKIYRNKDGREGFICDQSCTDAMKCSPGANLNTQSTNCRYYCSAFVSVRPDCNGISVSYCSYHYKHVPHCQNIHRNPEDVGSDRFLTVLAGTEAEPVRFEDISAMNEEKKQSCENHISENCRDQPLPTPEPILSQLQDLVHSAEVENPQTDSVVHEEHLPEQSDRMPSAIRIKQEILEVDACELTETELTDEPGPETTPSSSAPIQDMMCQPLNLVIKTEPNQTQHTSSALEQMLAREPTLSLNPLLVQNPTGGIRPAHETQEQHTSSCSVCAKKFPSHDLLVLHTLQEHQLQLSSGPGPVANTETRRKCSLCPISFPNTQLLLDHTRRDHQTSSSRPIEPRWKCRFCKSSFDTRQKLRNHKRTCHPARMPSMVAKPVVNEKQNITKQSTGCSPVQSDHTQQRSSAPYAPQPLQHTNRHSQPVRPPFPGQITFPPIPPVASAPGSSVTDCSPVQSYHTPPLQHSSTTKCAPPPVRHANQDSQPIRPPFPGQMPFPQFAYPVPGSIFPRFPAFYPPLPSQLMMAPRTPVLQDNHNSNLNRGPEWAINKTKLRLQVAQISEDLEVIEGVEALNSVAKELDRVADFMSNVRKHVEEEQLYGGQKRVRLEEKINRLHERSPMEQ